MFNPLGEAGGVVSSSPELPKTIGKPLEFTTPLESMT
jgi:hypothetical protein